MGAHAWRVAPPGVTAPHWSILLCGARRRHARSFGDDNGLTTVEGPGGLFLFGVQHVAPPFPFGVFAHNRTSSAVEGILVDRSGYGRCAACAAPAYALLWRRRQRIDYSQEPWCSPLLGAQHVAPPAPFGAVVRQKG